MRCASMSRPKRVPYQCAMRWRSAGSPVAGVYWVRPARRQASAARTTGSGALKSGSPMFRKIIGSPPCAGSQAGLCAICCAALAHSIT